MDNLEPFLTLAKNFIDTELLLTAMTFFGCYLIGSISFSIIISHMLVLPDPRTIGSGNAGATNVLRTGNKLAAFLTLLGDLLKGFLPVLLVRLYDHDIWVVSAAMLGIFFGHLYPLYFNFQGGKGVAATVGILIGLDYVLGLALAAFWVVIVAITRYASIGSLLLAIVSPVATYFWLGKLWAIPVLIISIFQIYKHWVNLYRLMHGQESKIRF